MYRDRNYIIRQNVHGKSALPNTKGYQAVVNSNSL